MSTEMRVYFLEYMHVKLLGLLPEGTTLFHLILVYFTLMGIVLLISHKFRPKDSYIEVFSIIFLTLTFVSVSSIFVYSK